MIILIAALAATSVTGLYALHLADSLNNTRTSQPTDGFEFATL